MKTAAASVAAVFALGAGAMAVLGGVLGASAEAASLGLVGAGLVGSSYLLGGKLGARAGREGAQRPVEQTRAA